MFRVTAFLITILLLLGTMLVSIAEEDTATAQAIADATSDAKNYNTISWATYGILSAPASACLFAVGCVQAPDIISPIIGSRVGIGACLGILPAAVVLSSNFVRVSPPTERLIGKSPEYVSVYMKTYTARVKHKRQNYAIGGSVVGCLAIGGFVLWFISDYDPWMGF